MLISIVIPTCNRQERLFSLLRNLLVSSYPVESVVVVDSSDIKLTASELEEFKNLNLLYIESNRSVCLQRNIGIRNVDTDWVFLCDDDIEIPRNYLEKLATHADENPEAGAISGLVMQKEKNAWSAQYPVISKLTLTWRYIFQLGMWGEIKITSRLPWIKSIMSVYNRKGNHITKAGWPALTDFSDPWFDTPVYGLGACLIKRTWLIHSPYDENLDPNGVGDNFGVAIGFPGRIRVLTDAEVYHHQEKINRKPQNIQYESRILALHYFLSTNKSFTVTNRLWFYWSIIGNLVYDLVTLNRRFLNSLSAFVKCLLELNPIIQRRNR